MLELRITKTGSRRLPTSQIGKKGLQKLIGGERGNAPRAGHDGSRPSQLKRLVQAGRSLAVTDGTHPGLAGIQHHQFRTVQIDAQYFKAGQDTIVGVGEPVMMVGTANANPQRRSGSGTNGIWSPTRPKSRAALIACQAGAPRRSEADYRRVDRLRNSRAWKRSRHEAHAWP